MNVNRQVVLPQKKLKYRFTCFISRGDVDECNSYSSDEESFTQVLLGEREIKSIGEADGACSIKSFHKDSRSLPVENSPNDKIPFDAACAEEMIIKPAPMQPDLEDHKRVDDEARLIAEGYKSKDGDDPHVYSRIIGVPPKCFVTTNTAYDPKSPPPTYFSEVELNEGKKVKKEELLAGFTIPAEGGLLCTDKEVIKRQSGVLTDLLKQIFTKFSIMQVSLPVRIFEPRSTCERIADFWRFAPYYLTNAAASRDVVERFKQVITFGISGLYCASQQLKPFNPLLGETFEGGFADGTKIYIEHTSHHPPMTHFYMAGPNDIYKMHGRYVYKVRLSANTLEALQDGPNIIEFPNGQKVIFRYPKIKIHGMIFGRRTIYPSGVMYFEDPVNNLRAAVVFNYGKGRGLFSSRKKGTKIDDFDGIMYHSKKGMPQQNISQLKELKDVDKVVGQITGSWLKELKIAGSIFWNIDKVLPHVIEYSNNPLPSDWRFREDLIWLRRNEMKISQAWKIRLEVEQRRDEKLRAHKKV